MHQFLGERRFALHLSLLLFVAASSSAQAQTWVDGNIGDFADPANWIGGVVPGAGSTAVFDGTSAGVDFNANTSNSRTIVNNGITDFNLNGNTYSIAVNSGFPQGALIVGQNALDDGTLNIGDGTVSLNYIATLGIAAGSKGTLNVGAGGTLNAYLSVGGSGEGIVNVTNGGIVGPPTSASALMVLGHADGGSGTVNVDGFGGASAINLSSTHYYGFLSNTTATVNITNGGAINAGQTFIAYGVDSVSNVTVDSGATFTSSSSMLVGYRGDAQLDISDGAVVTNSGNSLIGDLANSTGTVNMDNATWTSAGTVQVGRSGSGMLNLQNGSALTSNAGGSYIGTLTGSSGTATVDDSTWDDSSFLRVGNSGLGLLTVQNGGVVTTGISDSWVGAGSGAIGSIATVRDGGSRWDNAGRLLIGYGTLNIESGGVVTSTTGDLTSSASAQANVTGAGSLWDMSQRLVLSTGEVNILNQGRISTDSFVQVNQNGDLNVDGPGSILDVTSYMDNFGDLNVTDGGVVNINGTYFYNRNSVANTLISGAGSALNVTNEFRDLSTANGSFVVQDGGALNVGNGSVYNGSTMNVAGNGASINADEFYVGGISTQSVSVGTLNFNGGGVGNVTILKLWSPGTVNLIGGTLNVETLDLSAGGVLNHNAGLLNFTQDLNIGVNGPYASYVLTDLQSLRVDGNAVLDGSGSLTLDGGTFSAGTFQQFGTFTFNSGTFNLIAQDFDVTSGGLFGDDLQVESGQTINIAQTATVHTDGVLTLNGGRFSGGSLVNDGDIVLNSASSRLGGSLQNNSVLRGNGRVDAQLANAANGEVRVGSGERIHFTAIGNTNAGRIEVIGGEAEFDQQLVNQASTGNITGRNAILRFDQGLENQGNVGLSFGTSDVFGDISNNGTIIVSGNGNATFYDDYDNQGTTRVSLGSAAVFFGTVTGAGNYDGGGTFFFEGDLAPGNSPALTDIQGNMVLGLGANTIIELAGITRGSQYDAFDVSGYTELAGALDVTLLDAFLPVVGDVFDLIVANSINGSFDSVSLPTIAGIQWQLETLFDVGGVDILRLSASQIPVPAAVWLFASALGLLGWMRRRSE